MIITMADVTTGSIAMVPVKRSHDCWSRLAELSKKSRATTTTTVVVVVAS